MKIVCADCNSENCNKPGSQHLSWYLHCVSPEIVEKMLWKNAFEDDMVVRELCHELGWQGGTIHQVRDAIIEKQKEHKQGGYCMACEVSREVETAKTRLH